MNVINAFVMQRIKQNRNILALFCGATGSGKSYSALHFAESLDDSFNIDRVVFNVKDFMNLVNNPKLKAGNVIIFDEVGVGLSSRDWYSIQNKMFGSIMQTFRNKNLICLFTTPSISYIDNQLRYLFHLYFEAISINHKENLCYMKPMMVTYNPRFGKVYYKYPIQTTNGRIQTVVSMGFRLPSPELVKGYEIKKTEFTNKLNRDVETALRSMEDKNENKNVIFDANEYVSKILKNKKDFIKEYNHRRFVDLGKLKAEFGLSESKTKQVKALVERQLGKEHTEK